MMPTRPKKMGKGVIKVGDNQFYCASYLKSFAKNLRVIQLFCHMYVLYYSC